MPAETPRIPMISENSDSCPKVTDVWKLVLAWYDPILKRINKIIGFAIRAPRTKKISRFMCSSIPIKKICIPRATKKRMEKKSLTGEILDSNSVLNCEFARETPAMNAPIAIEMSLMYERMMNKKSTPREVMNSCSVDFAAVLKSLSSTNRCKRVAIRMIRPNFNIVSIIGIVLSSPAVNSAIAIIATRSCSNKIPRVSLPWRVTSSLLSASSFMSTMVDEKARIIPM